ncbi:uncharacterized protein LOC114882602 [Osmia bicornis bicornis]|uniref:uncharacterized protein LOC114882602 n=1 Tax=Osmia bicornis bicornis TaxID=1437191 RepID=UPI001EAF5CD6|nr:uncharacterized protein LOC114882602 [Osmia bicornis bicornis]
MQNEKLIEIVRHYTFVYNQEEKNYSDNYKKDAAWKEIGEILNQPANECKKHWNNLRDCYRRSLKRKNDTKSGQAANKVKKWKYEDEMSFLTKYMKERETVTSIQINVSEESNQDVDDTTTIEDNSNFIETPAPSQASHTSTQFRKKKRKRTGTASDSLMNYILNNTKEEKAMDEIDLFFKSTALTVKELTPYNQIIAKTRISSIISELQLQELSNINCHHFSSQSLSSTPTPSPCTIEPLQPTHPQKPNTICTASNFYTNI